MHSMPSASATARSARSTFTAEMAVSRSSWLNASGSVPVMARYCSSCMPWAWMRMARSWRRSCISWLISGSGSSSVTRAASASPTFSRSAIWAWALRTLRHPIGQARPAARRPSRTPTPRDAHSSVISGSTFSLTSLTAQLELQLALLVGVGVGGREGEGGRRPDAPTQVLVDLGGDGAGADRVAVVVGGEPGLRLAVERAGDVDGDRVAVLTPGGRPPRACRRGRACGRSGRRAPLRRRPGRSRVTRQAAVARHLDRGAHLDDGVEGDVAGLLAAGDVDLGRGDHVDVVLDHGGRVVLGERVLQRLLPARRAGRGGPRAPCGAPCRAGSPGRRTSLAIFLNAASTAVSNSPASTSTDSLTLFPSRGSTVLFMRRASVSARLRRSDMRCRCRRVPCTGHGEWRSGSAPALGAGGRGFKSPLPDHLRYRRQSNLRV